MSAPDGFTYIERGDGSIRIMHRGRLATTVRGARAATFLEQIAAGDPQQVMARWTGAYKIGNERTARNHPRNRGR